MRALTSIRGIVAARWFPYVLIGWASSVLGAAGWSYIRGYDTAEAHHQAQLSEALDRQLKREREQAARELKLAIKTERAKHEAQRRISEVPRPVVSCDLPPECLQWYDDVLQAAGSDIGGTD